MTVTDVRARWLDLGTVDPLHLHATVQGVAEAQGVDAAPLAIWARARRPHVCLGASQGADAELDLGACRRAGIDIVRRPLGGGTVWVDDDQWCFFLSCRQGAGSVTALDSLRARWRPRARRTAAMVLV